MKVTSQESSKRRSVTTTSRIKKKKKKVKRHDKLGKIFTTHITKGLLIPKQRKRENIILKYSETPFSPLEMAQITMYEMACGKQGSEEMAVRTDYKLVELL